LAWTIEYDPRAIRDLQKLPRPVRIDVISYLDTRIKPADSPRNFGKSLRHDKFGLWRYRMAEYRIVCQINDATNTILVVGVGHRKNVYD